MKYPNALSQAAALAAWNDEAYFTECIRRIRRTRERLLAALDELGFEVEPSAANFLFARCHNTQLVYEQLKQKGVLVRWFNTPPVDRGVRITIGTDAQVDALLEKLSEMKI